MPRPRFAYLALFLSILLVFIAALAPSQNPATTPTPRPTPLLSPTTAPLRLEQVIPLTGVGGPLGHMSADALGRRLFVAALGNNTVEIIDLRAGRLTAEIANMNQPQGILYEANSRKLFVTSGGNGTCSAFDAATSFSLLATVPLGGNASAIRYAPSTRQVIVAYGAGALGFIDAGNLTHVGDIALAGPPAGFQLEHNSNRAFVNVPDTLSVTVVDRALRTVSEAWPLGSLSQNYPMALDESHNRLFVGCRRPAMMQVFDTAGGAITQFGLADDADDMHYDARHARLYVSCGQGILDVIAQDSPDTYHLMMELPTAPGARTSLYDPLLDRLFVGLPLRPGHPAEIRVYAPVP